MSDTNTIDRREFLKAGAAMAAVSAVPAHVLGGARHVPPSERINIAYIGTGTQGLRNLMDALPRKELRITAVCDPNTESNDYPEWGRNEIRNKIRAFLGDDRYGEGVQGCRCGRNVGIEVVERYYGKNKPDGRYQGCKPYVDFRELLANESDVDALYIMTPEHLHTAVAVAAMNKGKHAITHKPISNVHHEIVVARDTAQKTAAATHLFCAASNSTTPTITEWIEDGAIGPVREVHNWSSRPFWPQGMTALPSDRPPIPEGLIWDLWLGPVPHRPYHPAYTHAVFRGWCDFGSGALGDMGHYSFFQIFKVLGLGQPRTVEASRSCYWAIENLTWSKQPADIAWPRASMIHWEFPARGDRPEVSLFWYDGGLRPPKPAELDADGQDMPDEGMLFVGDKGKLLTGFTGGDPRLIPASRMTAYKKPPQRLPRPQDELTQWIHAIRGGEPSSASFQNAYDFSTTIALGNIALRVDKKLIWDADHIQFANSDAANKLRHRTYRPGWEL
ncbi:MAG TPA: gfo/Idh/MocA family oxidoreductase [Phycisphaerales bacterium]|nr:gfo/Idh/MocA family oxidoreductase [Phycisphaerales bacterium]